MDKRRESERISRDCMVKTLEGLIKTLKKGTNVPIDITVECFSDNIINAGTPPAITGTKITIVY